MIDNVFNHLEKAKKSAEELRTSLRNQDIDILIYSIEVATEWAYRVNRNLKRKKK